MTAIKSQTKRKKHIFISTLLFIVLMFTLLTGTACAAGFSITGIGLANSMTNENLAQDIQSQISPAQLQQHQNLIEMQNAIVAHIANLPQKPSNSNALLDQIQGGTTSGGDT
jgi:hypothetical protein